MDTHGNVSDRKEAVNGQKWAIIGSKSGDVLKLDTEPSSDPTEVELKNELTSLIDAHIYKDGRLLMNQTGVKPKNKGVFKMNMDIYVGIHPQVKEGQEINAALLNDFDHMFSLEGIKKADLIMTGGGSGPHATPFVFKLIPTS